MALKTELNGDAKADKDWLRAAEAARLYGLPKTWFEERGRAGDIARAKPGRYTLFQRRDIENATLSKTREPIGRNVNKKKRR